MNKQWNPELWKPIGLKPVEIEKTYQISETKSFYDYQDPAKRYEVRGIMPKAPNPPKPGFEPY